MVSVNGSRPARNFPYPGFGTVFKFRKVFASPAAPGHVAAPEKLLTFHFPLYNFGNEGIAPSPPTN